MPVPQTDTGRRGENPKVIERTLVKELGKMTPYFGRRGALSGCKPERAAVNRPRRLFSKNTGLCEAVRRSIGADACPVLEG